MTSEHAETLKGLVGLPVCIVATGGEWSSVHVTGKLEIKTDNDNIPPTTYRILVGETEDAVNCAYFTAEDIREIEVMPGDRLRGRIVLTNSPPYE